MPTVPESRDYGLLEQLADEFAERHRRGERPTVQEYAERYPALADDLRELLPAMVELEKVQQVMAPEAPSAPPEGDRLLGDFRIMREIGRGGMGVVYEAEQLSLGRRVALKVLTQKMLTDAKQKRRFEREARAAAKLHHTNIVPVFGFGQNDGTPFYVMQFIHGMGLDQVVRELAGMALNGKTTAAFLQPEPSRADVSAAAVAVSLLTGHFKRAEEAEAEEAAAVRTVTAAQAHRNGDADATGSAPSHAPAPTAAISSDSSGSHSSATLPGQGAGGKLSYWQSIARVGAQVADALDYAHKQGIIHRDIKPSNLLLDMAGTVWVADFGLAKADDQQDLTHTGDILGTLRYMPPEAFVGRVDARGDVYALGLTLYEMLALRPAFEERDRHKLIGLVTTSEPPPLLKLRPDVPRDLETIVHKAIDRDPNRRYQTAAEFRDDLQRFIADEPIKARRQTALEAGVRWARRHPGTAVLTGLILLLMVGATVGSLIAASHFDQLAQKAEQTADGEREARELAASALASAVDSMEVVKTQRINAERLREAADRLAKAADKQRRATERLVARQYVEAGTRLASDGDVAGALLWNVAAIQADPDQADMVRTRLGVMLKQTPLPVHTLFHDSAIVSFKIDPQGRTVAAICENGSVVIHDLETGTRLHTLDSEGTISYLAYSRDGSRIVTLSAGEAGDADDIAPPPRGMTDELQVWSVRDGKPLTPPLPHVGSTRSANGGYGQNSAPTYAASLPANQFFCLGDERIVTCPDAKTCKLHEAATGKEVATVRVIEEGSLRVGEVSSDGKRLLLWEQAELPKQPAGGSPAPGFGSILTPTVHVVDVTDTAKPVRWEVRAPRDFRGVEGPPSFVNFSPDGSFVLASGNGGVRVFDTAGKKIAERLAPPGASRSGDPFLSRFSPDGRFLAVSDSGINWGWNVALRQETVVFDLHTKQELRLPLTIQSAIGFGPRGHFLLARTSDRTLVLNAETGQTVSQLPADVGTSVWFSPDGQHVLVSQGDTAIRVYDASTGQRALPWLPHESPVNQSVFTPDSSRVVTAAGTALRVWPLSRRTDSARTLATGTTRVVTSFLSPNGSRVVTIGSAGAATGGGFGVTYVARVWDAETAQPLSEPSRLPGSATSGIGKSKGGSATSGGTFDSTGEWLLLRSSFGSGPGYPGSAPSALHLPTGKLTEWPTQVFSLLDNYWTPTGGTPLWSPTGPHLLRTTEYVNGLNRNYGSSTGTFDPGSLFYPPRPKSTVEVVDPEGKPSATLSFPAAVSATWAPDGRHVVTITGERAVLEATLWAFQPGKPLEKVRYFPPLIASGRNWESFSDAGYRGSYSTPWVSFSADGKRLLFRLLSGSEYVVRIWDVASGQAAGAVQNLDGGSGRQSGVPQLGPDGTVLFALGVRQQNRGIRVIDVATGKDRIPMMVPTEALSNFAVSPNGKRVLTRGANTVQLWDVQTGELLTTPLLHESGLSSAEFTADGRRVITRTRSTQSLDDQISFPKGGPGGASRNSGDIRIWDATTGQPLLLGLGLSSDIQWDRNGTRVLQNTVFGNVVIYDLAPDSRPVDELRELAETLAARRVSGGGGLVVLDPARIAAGWGKTAQARTAWGTVPAGKDWHDEQIRQLGGTSPTGLIQFQSFGRPGGGSSGAGSGRFTIPATALRWHLDQFLTLDPEDRGRRLQRANIAFREGDWKQAIADFTDIPGEQITRSFLQLRGNAHAELGQWNEARRDFQGYAEWLKNPDPAIKGGPPSLAKVFLAGPRAMVELQLGNRDEFKRIMEQAERDVEELRETSGGQPYRSIGEQYLWPSLLLDGPPPKALAALYAPRPNKDPGDPPLSGVGGGRSGGTNIPFPLAAGVAYRQGDTEKVVKMLEDKLGTERDCTAAECFLLAMAAKKKGNDFLADLAFARGVKLIADPSKEPPPDDPRDFRGGPSFVPLTWEKQVMNETLRREAEEVVRGKKP